MHIQDAINSVLVMLAGLLAPRMTTSDDAYDYNKHRRGEILTGRWNVAMLQNEKRATAKINETTTDLRR